MLFVLDGVVKMEVRSLWFLDECFAFVFILCFHRYGGENKIPVALKVDSKV